MSRSSAGIGVLGVVVAGLALMPAFSADEKGKDKSAFPPALRVAKLEKGEAPKLGFGYVSGSAGGAFTLNGAEGHASFRWNHGLDVDWHDHPTKYAGLATDMDDRKYWVYMLSYPHGGHTDYVWLYFAQQKVPSDTGYRIFFGHSDKEGAKPDEHDIHVWCTDASRYGTHDAHADDKAGKFRVLQSK
jgi:hypothetical protein